MRGSASVSTVAGYDDSLAYRRAWLLVGISGGGALVLVSVALLVDVPRPWTSLMGLVGAIGTMALTAFMFFAWFRSGPRMLGFVIVPGAFVAPPRHLLAAGQTSLGVTMAAMFTSFWSSIIPESVTRAISIETVVVLTIAATVYVSILTAGLWLAALIRRVPRAALSQDGVHIQTMINSRRIPWDALAPGGVPRPNLGAFGELTLYSDPRMVRVTGLLPQSKAQLSNAWSAVHPWFLADAIRYYVTHPEHRAAIGTPEEHDRLRQVLGAVPSTVEVGGATGGIREGGHGR